MLLVLRRSILVPSEHLRVTMHDLVDEMPHGHVMEATDETMQVVVWRMPLVMPLHVIEVMEKMDEYVIVLESVMGLSGDQVHIPMTQTSVKLQSMYERLFQAMLLLSHDLHVLDL